MKNTFFKVVLMMAVLFNASISFAQDDNPGSPVGDDDPTSASISANLIILLGVALIFGAYMVTKKIRETKAA